MIVLLQKKVNSEAIHNGLYLATALLATFAWGSPPQTETHLFLLLPERQTESCPDDLKSTGFCVPFILLLYQIDHLCVK